MIITKEIKYFDEETLCQGFMAFDDNWNTKKPAVLVAHDWSGRDHNACNATLKLAQLGYLGFAIDMYGHAQIGKDKIEKRKLLTPFIENRQATINRISAAFNVMLELPLVNSKKIAAIGYCFGGMCVLDLARSGAEIKGAVSFHGILTSPGISLKNPIKSKVLVLHGYNDPLITPKQVDQFCQEMSKLNVDWQVHLYGNTAHSFTNPEANDNEMGLHYNKIADQRSWETTKEFLNNLFSRP